MRSTRWARDDNDDSAKDAETSAFAGADRPVSGRARGRT
jgi:hypothetical protein